MKSCDFTAKGTSLRESTSFEPFCVNGQTEREKSQKVSGSRRNDVSPLTPRACATAQPVRKPTHCGRIRNHQQH